MTTFKAFLVLCIVACGARDSAGYTTSVFGAGSVISTGIGDSAWTLPTNALTQNLATASCDLAPSGVTEWLSFTNFGFSTMASSAVLSGINVSFVRRAENMDATIVDVDVQLYLNSVAQGGDKSLGATWLQTGALQTVYFGGATDMWGTSLNATQVKNSLFGIRIKAARSPGDANPRRQAIVDFVGIQLTYNCPAGTFGTSCTVCPTGQYSDFPNSASCTSCTSGASTVGNTPADHDSPTDCVCAPGSAGSPGGPCTACAATEYQDLINQPMCKSCPSNTRVLTPPATALSSCVCVAGSYGSAGSACTLCAAGTSQANTGSASCPVCAANTYQNALGSVSCNSCPANSQTQGTLSSSRDEITDCVCSAGFGGSAGGPCVGCSPGEFATLNSPSCSSCSAGTYSLARASSCTTCPANQYQPNVGSGSCIACQSNSVTTTSTPAGHDSQLDCLCLIGFAGTTTCTACPAGSISTAQGQASCTVCAADTYQQSSTQSTCIACPTNTSTQGPAATDHDSLADCQCLLGHFGPSGAACGLCPDNTYQDMPGQSSCNSCPPNTSLTGSTGSSRDAVTDCLCDVGHYGPPGSACALCDNNSYQPQQGQTSCLACPPNSKSSGTTAVSHDDITDCVCDNGYSGIAGGNCTACPTGTFGNGLDQQSCMVCGVGEYQSSPASTSCIPCLQGLTTLGSLPENHDSPTDCVCEGGRVGPAGGPCTPCDAGKFSNPGDLACTDCPPGTFSAAPGAPTCTVCGSNEFQPASNSTSCLLCPPGLSTNGAEANGHDDVSDCLEPSAAESSAAGDLGVVIGAAAGGGALFIIIVIVVVLVLRRRSSQDSSSSIDAPSGELELEFPTGHYAPVSGSIISHGTVGGGSTYGNVGVFASLDQNNQSMNASDGVYDSMPSPQRGYAGIPGSVMQKSAEASNYGPVHRPG